MALHTNKGLAGAPAEAIEAARDTAMNPAVLDAFALIICAAEEPPAYPGIRGHEPNLSAARRHAEAIDRAMNEVRKLLPNVGSYLAESDFYDEAWWQSFLGRTTQSCSQLRKSTIPTDSSSCIMEWAVNVGASTASRSWPDAKLPMRCLARLSTYQLAAAV